MPNTTRTSASELLRKPQQTNSFGVTKIRSADGSTTLKFTQPQAMLSVPEGLDEMSNLDAALAYAEAGWYVLPVAPGTKNPGSVVGDGWQHSSSREPAQIREWWTENPDYGIAVHVGRSGAVLFDLDTDSLGDLPTGLRKPFEGAVFQQSRRGKTDRGHYLFAVNSGDQFGNSAGAFAPFGDVRGKNGVIIVAPTPHVDPNGEYRWIRSGVLPQLPDILRECLRAAPDNEVPPLDDAELTEFFADHTGDARPRALDGVLAVFERNVSGGMSRHEALVQSLPMAYREAMAGCYPAELATMRLQEAFISSFVRSVSDAGRRSPAPDEFFRTARWAAAQAQLADPEETLARMNRDDPATAVVDEEAFWLARPELQHLRTFARSRKVGPWSMFGSVVARAAAVIPPSVVLPALVGDYGSLNQFVAIAAKSGSGKGTSEAAAEAFLVTDPEVHTATPGSGEGILKEYAYKKKADQIDLRNSVLFSVPEIDSLAALKGRSGSTLMPELRKAWMGEQLGFGYAADDKKFAIKKHRYRMSMVVGVQPGRSQTLFEDADGGTPQRFLWFPTTDIDRPERRPDDPGPLKLPRWPGGVLVTEQATEVGHADSDGEMALRFSVQRMELSQRANADHLQVLGVPQVAIEAIDAEQDAKLDGRDADDLDSHGLLMQLKVAAVLMFLAGRTDAITVEDWELARIVKAISDRTRAQVQKTLRAKVGASNRSRGRAEGERKVAEAETIETAKIERAVGLVRKHLTANGTLTRKAGRSKLKNDIRDHFDEAADRLVGAGVAERIEGDQGSYSLVLKSLK